MKSNIQYFKDREEKISEQIRFNARRSILLSLLRLVSFLLMLFSFVWGIVNEVSVFVYGGIAFFVAFLLLCFVHSRVRGEQELLENLYISNASYIARIEGDFDMLGKIAVTGLKRREEQQKALARLAGEEFIDLKHDYCVDLDLFGKKSLFALYNVSETGFGRRAFAGELLGYKSYLRSVRELKERQSAVREMSGKPAFLQRYQAEAVAGDVDDPVNLSNFAKNGKEASFFSKAVPVYSSVHLACAAVRRFLFPLRFAKAMVLLVILINLIFWIVGLRVNAEYLD